MHFYFTPGVQLILLLSNHLFCLNRVRVKLGDPEAARDVLQVIAARDFQEIWIETASLLISAVKRYGRNSDQAATGVETARCDRVEVKFLDTHQLRFKALLDLKVA